ncbi:hypothetical protein [Mycobacterium sp. shizuoka-1]|uniref:hypothetical protein n=1 Tax=Mycobacterium sp. shizuoka-1 TaxID=2039281 RepID=UPI000C0656CB|nr:hypothetical protein [Mycobacterium sp. shizuoka-1]GAY17817.1 hypothetical protein MSZK_45430 [Mycobacterium sp. shizuoka-1]
MPDSVLPPSRFGAGYTVGSPPPTALPATDGTQLRSQSPTGPAVSSPPAGPATNAPISSLALASFVLVLLMGPFIAPLTIPLSLIARRHITQSGSAGAGLAKAALAMSCIYLIAAAVVVVLLVVVRPA